MLVVFAGSTGLVVDVELVQSTQGSTVVLVVLAGSTGFVEDVELVQSAQGSTVVEVDVAGSTFFVVDVELVQSSQGWSTEVEPVGELGLLVVVVMVTELVGCPPNEELEDELPGKPGCE